MQHHRDRQQAEETLRHVRQLVGPAQKALSDARALAAEAVQAAERASLRRDTGNDALTRAESELAAAPMSRFNPTKAEVILASYPLLPEQLPVRVISIEKAG